MENSRMINLPFSRIPKTTLKSDGSTREFYRTSDYFFDSPKEEMRIDPRENSNIFPVYRPA